MSDLIIGGKAEQEILPLVNQWCYRQKVCKYTKIVTCIRSIL